MVEVSQSDSDSSPEYFLSLLKFEFQELGELEAASLNLIAS